MVPLLETVFLSLLRHEAYIRLVDTEEVRQEFQRHFGYALPSNIESARKDPKVWLDVINFRTDEFAAGWRQVYRIIKELNPHIKVITTHDSHNTFAPASGQTRSSLLTTSSIGERILPTLSQNWKWNLDQDSVNGTWRAWSVLRRFSAIQRFCTHCVQN
jgi:hypothetical protein